MLGPATVLLLLAGSGAGGNELTVDLRPGTVRGEEVAGEAGPYLSFTGIPYARPPTGDRRFLRPEPVEPWAGVEGGRQVECAQEETGRARLVPWGPPLRGEEDCLVINAYTPGLEGARAVMVFIHGGGYFAGSGGPGVYGPDYLVGEGVVLVTVNYRLGPLGFLSLGADSLLGNQGLWDVALALQFVQENVAALGGDPEKVTLFGQSAGAMAVQLMMLSDQTRHRGLFRAAILQSGPILSAFSHSDKHPAFYCRTLAAAVGCPSDAAGPELLACLQLVPIEELIRHVRLFDHEDQVMHNAPNPWKPIHDGLFLRPDSALPPFLARDPLDSLEAGLFPDIPVIIGQTRDEGLYAVAEVEARNPGAADTVLADWARGKGPSYLLGREEDEIVEAEVEIAREFLDRFLEGGRSRDPFVLQNWFSPSVWTAAGVRTAGLLARGKTAPTFQYYYTHAGRLSLTDILSGPLWKLVLKMLAAKVNIDLFYNTAGATHFDEIFLLFKGHDIPFLQRHSAEDQTVSSLLVTLWTHFAVHGEPGPVPGQPGPLAWRPLRPGREMPHLEIGGGATAIKDSREAFANVTAFFERVWAVAPPRLHLPRSRTWSAPGLHGPVPYRAPRPRAGEEL